MSELRSGPSRKEGALGAAGPYNRRGLRIGEGKTDRKPIKQRTG